MRRKKWIARAKIYLGLLSSHGPKTAALYRARFRKSDMLDRAIDKLRSAA